MLTHLENFNFSPLLINLDWLHIRLIDCLDCELVSVLLVLSELYHAELTLAEVSLQLVKVIDIEFANYLANRLNPLRLTFNGAEVKDSRFIWRQNNLNWVQVATRVRVHLWRRLLDKSSSEAVHNTLVVVTLLAVAHEILAKDLGPVLFESVCARLKETLAL